MQLGLLGPLEVRIGDREVPIAGVRLRSLLCRLALKNTTIDAAKLIRACRCSR